ncbi:hypothetical protein [Candidatus Wolbachia massiliensis]|uniref:Uncharacterized protein n=1 Tax=Candidatus Wolbachia massiliensis TaxID=1845000 RepID=A0A7M3U2N6_9RICK|nr:hypothetical protein [Candidatus Wolbachia massiliensis]QOD38671.1 hypothetical protein ID128_02250 [Candidatus Wolbachia massiliensis]
MAASGSVLKRYALAYIKKSGGNDNIKEFLQHCKNVQDLTWSEDKFAKVYKEFIGNQNLNNGQNIGSGRNGYNGSNVDPGAQNVHIHVHNRGLDLWDYLLLQCCINSLFGGHTTNVTNINYGNTTNQSRENKSEDRKLLALGIAVAVVCAAFHGLMCYFYYSSKKEARKSDKIDYLDDKLKTFRNIEFAVSAISLAALIACAFCPVLSAWSLVILGVNSLVCLAGGVAFHMKHQEELDNIEKAKTAVEGCVSTHCSNCERKV